MKSKKFRRVEVYERVINGKTTRIAVFQKADLRIEVRLNEVDHIERLTTSPKKWLDSRIVIPTGRRDEKGRPVYKVLQRRNP